MSTGPLDHWTTGPMGHWATENHSLACLSACTNGLPYVVFAVQCSVCGADYLPPLLCNTGEAENACTCSADVNNTRYLRYRDARQGWRATEA